MAQDAAEAAKQAAGKAAAALVEDGMLLGLGTGSTVRHLVDALGRRVREEGLRITGVPTSVATATQATALGIKLADPDQPIDLAIDGADEVERRTLRPDQGPGRRAASRKDRGTEWRDKLGHHRRCRQGGDKCSATHSPLPVEVTRFGLAATTRRVAEAGGQPVLRRGKDGEPFVTDGGNCILDCAGFAPIADPFTLDRTLRAIAGVIETGLFLQIATEALIAHPDGRIETLRVSTRQ